MARRPKSSADGPPGPEVRTLEQVVTRARLFGGAGSLLLHALFAVSAWGIAAAPPPLFEVNVPVDVVLGLTDATEVASPAPTAPVPAGEGSGGGGGSGPGEPTMDAGVPVDAAGPWDAGVPGDGGVPRDAPRRRRRDAGPDAPIDAGVDAAALVASEDGEGEGGDGEGRGASVLPPGAQVAIRIDMDRVRASPVRLQVESLLRNLRDWRALIGSRDLEPVRDFSRVLIASANLSRAHFVVAGRLAETAPAPRELAETLARGRGETVTWAERDGVVTTAWPVDATPRTLAILGPRQFVVSHEDDLPRVLAIAAARAEEGVEPGEALLSMGEGEALTLEVEGARHYVRAGSFECVVPRSLRLALVEEETGVRLRGRARFDDEPEAATVVSCLEGLRDRYAGMAMIPARARTVIAGLTAQADGDVVALEGFMPYSTLQLLLVMASVMAPGTEPDEPTSPPAPPPPAP